jgi:hypothetical protein
MAEQEGRSITWVIIMLMLVVAWLGWTSLAASYAHSEEEWQALERPDETDDPPRFGRRGAIRSGGAMLVTAFVGWVANGFSQLPNLVSVIKFGFTERLWLVGLFAGFEVVILVLGLKMKQLEESFADSPDSDMPVRRRKKKRRRK